MKIVKITVEIELKPEFQENTVQDVYNIIKENINKFSDNWTIPKAHFKW